MSSKEARKLLGGYATGSLTEAERTALFQHALEDQEVFEELAGEQLLKEVLDQPGARQRLLHALEPPRRPRVWLWAGVAASAAVAVVIGFSVSRPTPPPTQEIAQVMTSPEPVNPPVAPLVPQAPPVRRKAAPKAVPPPPEQQQQPQPLAQFKALDNAAAENTPETNAQEARTRSAPVQPPTAVGALSQFAAGPPATIFAFNYAVTPGFLQILPAAPGYLSVSANDMVVFPSAAVSPLALVRVAIPSGTSSLGIGFSKEQGIGGTPVRRDETSGAITDQDPPNGKIFIQLFLTPATR